MKILQNIKKYGEDYIKIYYECIMINPVIIVGRQAKRFLDKRNRNKNVYDIIKNTDANELIPVQTYTMPPSKENFTIAALSENEKIFASQFLGHIINAGFMANSYSGLLQCNIDPTILAETKDGFLRGYVIGSNGKFVKQAKFSQVDIPELSAPLIGFQVISFITGQYYQHKITEQLSDLNNKITQILELAIADDQGTITSIFDTLKRYSQMECYQIEDYVLAENNLQSLDKLRKKYKKMANDIDIQVGMSQFFNFNEASSWIKKLSESNYFRYLEIALWSEYLFFVNKVILIKMNIERGGFNDLRAKMYLSTLDYSFHKDYADKYHSIKKTIIYNLEKLTISSGYEIEKDAIIKEKTHLEDKFNRIEKLFKEKQAELEPVQYFEIADGNVVGKYIPKTD